MRISVGSSVAVIVAIAGNHRGGGVGVELGIGPGQALIEGRLALGHVIGGAAPRREQRQQQGAEAKHRRRSPNQ
jgi:hypothetical protein